MKAKNYINCYGVITASSIIKIEYDNDVNKLVY